MLPLRLPRALRRNLFACCTLAFALGSATAQTAINTLAGSSPAIASGNVDATGTAARFNGPHSVAVDASGHIYVADTGNHAIRRITPSGVVTTLAGTGFGSADGTGTAAYFSYPRGIATDGTRVYVADSNNCTIRQIEIATGVVTTLAGSPGAFSSEDGTGAAARFGVPFGVTVAGTDLYVADTGSHTIRKIVIATGVVTTIAGTAGSAGSIDATGSAARFRSPTALAADGTTYLYVADTANHTIRKIALATGVVTTLAGTASTTGGSTDSTGTSASFKSPGGIVFSGANLFVADTGNNTIRRIGIVNQIVDTIAGFAGSVGATDALGTAARFQGPTGIGANAAGTLYIADTNNHTIRSAGAASAPVLSGPVNIAVAVGASATFTVTANGNPSTFTYQWYSAASGSDSFQPFTDALGIVQGSNTNAVTRLLVPLSASGTRFQVVVSNGVGAPVTSAPATLTVQAPPVITSANNVAFSVGVPSSFTIIATGSPAPSFSVVAGTFPSWAALNPLTGVISGTPTTTTGSPFIFTIQAANGVVPAATQTFTLNVSAPAPAGLINLSSRLDVPASGVTAYFRVDGTTTKQVLIRGIGPTLGLFGVAGAVVDPRLELMDASGATIAANDDWGGGAALSNAFAVVGAFALPAASKDAALLATLAPGFYAVRASGVNGAVGSALIEVYEADTATRTAVFSYLALRGVANTSFSTGFVLSGGGGPASVVVRAAGPALAQSGALSDPVLWLFSGATSVGSNDNWGFASNVSGIVATAANFGAIPFSAGSKDSALSATLTSRDNTIQVNNTDGASGVALVEIFDASASTVPRSPFLYSPPVAQSVLAGQNANFSVTAGGNSTLSYQWRRNGTPISGATSPSYSFTTAASDSANYDVVVSNTVGSLTSVAASLTVTVPAPPTIISATGSGTIGAGFNTVFSVTATGTAPLTYQWRKDGVALASATNSTLSLTAVTVPHSGVYDVIVSNGGGSVTSVPLPLTVTPAVAPAITAQPVGGTLNIGNLASFRVTATGSPTLTYQWRKNGSPVAGATSSTYVLGSATAASAGSFDVIVTNMAGTVTSTPAVLLINPPVVFNSQPASVTTFVGIAVSFSAPATGFPGTPTYQWRKDGVALDGATSSTFTLASALLTDAGSYDVIATAVAGSATSNAAILTVSDSAPQITSQPGATTLAVGGNTVLAISAVGSGPLTYQWRRDGVSLVGATTATFPVANAQTFDAGLYTVVVTNGLGSVTSAAARLNVVPRVVAYSARLLIESDGAVAVFTIEGTLPKKVLLRAVGPGLAPFGLSGLPDPQLELFNSTGTLLALNNDWATSADVAALTNVTAAVGAFALAIGSRDSAILTTLAPGTYTVRAKPASGAGGTGYLELYDADLATAPMSTLPYVAVRGRMGAGGGVVIGGLGSNGRGQRSYLVRAIGPTLGLPGALANPAMLVVRDGTLVGSNDDWDASSTDAIASATAAARVAAFPLPAGGRDSALVLTGNLHAGSCTVQVAGSDTLGGTVLLELHDLDAARPATFAPAIASAPVHTTVATGEATTLRVLAHGTAPLSYQWRKDGIPLDGATTSTLPLASVQPSQGGSYTVFVSNALGSATSLSAVLTVQSGSSGSVATQAVVGSGYTAGGTATITNTLSFTTTPTGLGWKVTLPVGWSFVSDAGALGDVRPVPGTIGALEWAWSTPPASPVTFTYTVSVPVGTAGEQLVAASGLVRFGGSVSQPVATPSPLWVPRVTATHSADTNADFSLSLFELTRVIELYNTRLGTTRTGRYQVLHGTEDGFGIDAVTPGATAVTLARYHSADRNRDASLSLVELTRVIELFNTRAGATRTGTYHVQSGTEDGFAPGP